MRVIKRDAGHNAGKWAAVALFAFAGGVIYRLYRNRAITRSVFRDHKGPHIAFRAIVPISGVVPHGRYYIKESSRKQLLDVEYKVHLSGSSVQLKYGSTVLYSGSKLTLVRASGNTEDDFIVFPYSPTQGTRTNYYGNIEFSVNSGLVRGEPCPISRTTCWGWSRTR